LLDFFFSRQPCASKNGYRKELSSLISEHLDFRLKPWNSSNYKNAPALTAAFNSRFTDNIMRIGVNYKFDYAGAIPIAY
jgi:uncharacterized protein YihD (DUF1040 family)